MTRLPPASPLPMHPLRRGTGLQRALAGAAVLSAVLLMHAALLARLPARPGAGLPAPAAPVLQVRQVLVLMAPPVAAPATEQRADRAAAAVVRRPSALIDASPGRAEPATPTRAAVSAAPGDGGPGVTAASPAAESPADGAAPPRYATRLPPPATLQYTLQREAAGPGRSGLQAELRWRPAQDRYTLTMGFGAVGWASLGQLDADGVAPERHVETRRGRELRAASFRREAGPGGGRITFSGPPVEHALLPGVQDRLSWMLQLAAVLEADPALGQPGREVQLFVVGVRGDAAVWTFKVLDRGAAELPAGTVADAVHLRREPQRAFDTLADVWLDPARHHLPVRLRLNNRGEGDGNDFLLSRLSLP